jgi:hypothetical protein
MAAFVEELGTVRYMRRTSLRVAGGALISFAAGLRADLSVVWFSLAALLAVLVPLTLAASVHASTIQVGKASQARITELARREREWPAALVALLLALWLYSWRHLAAL